MSKIGPGRILVTGGAGFIGLHVVNRLVALGHRVLVIDDLSTGRRENLNPAAELTVGSVTDERLMQEVIGRVDACIHLAAIASVQRSQKDCAGSHRVNQSAFVNLMGIVARRGGGTIPVVYASSSAVYGAAGKLPITEDMPARPLSAYGADKFGCELHAYAAGQTAGISSLGLRFFNVYGVGQRPDSPYSGVISIFIDRLLRGERLTICGDGHQSRDFVHIDDAVSAITAALDHASPEACVCNVGTGIEKSILELAVTLCSLLGKPTDFEFAAAREGDIMRSVANISRAQKILDYRPRIALYEGLLGLVHGKSRPISDK
jgi:UDP-glucose 4-epimerase